MSQPFVISLLFVLILLAIGFVLRAGIGPLRKLFIPASVVGGLLGLAVMQAGLRVGEAELVTTSSGVGTHTNWIFDDDEGAAIYPITIYGSSKTETAHLPADFPKTEPNAVQRTFAEISNTIDGWPGLLIAVVFAGLLMDKPGRRFGEAMGLAARQGIVVWIIVLGQAFVGLLAAALLIAPFYDVPPIFGQLIETGFAGGHGTAAAMGQVFDQQFAFPAGRDLSFLFATVGLVYGVVSGIFFVNLGVRRGWLRGGPHARRVGFIPPSNEGTLQQADGGINPTLPYESPEQPSDFTIPVVTGLEDRHDPKPGMLATVRSDVIDPLAFQLVLLGCAFGIGMLLQWGFLAGAEQAAPYLERWIDNPMKFVGNIPLFLFTLLGGLILRELMHLIGFGDLIDAGSIHRLTGIAMEILIVAALATLRLEAAAEYIVPVLILLGVGFAWTAFCLLYVGRKLLPQKYWFELGLMNYGMSTATTAQGIMLLRIVDRDLDTGAAEDYAAAAPLSAPFIGGGLITVLGIPLMAAKLGVWPVILASGIVLAGLFVLGWMLRGKTATQ